MRKRTAGTVEKRVMFYDYAYAHVYVYAYAYDHALIRPTRNLSGASVFTSNVKGQKMNILRWRAYN